MFIVLAGSVLPPELQCFISDSQLTRDAALHLGPEDCIAAVNHAGLLLYLPSYHLWSVPSYVLMFTWESYTH